MAVQIQSFKRVVPMIYAYNTPGVVYHDGWTKIGYTEKQTPAISTSLQDSGSSPSVLGESLGLSTLRSKNLKWSEK